MDQLQDIQGKVHQIYNELMGSDLSKRGGLIQNVQELKIANAEINQRLQKVENNQNIVRIIIYTFMFGLLIGALIFGFISIKEVLSLSK